MSKIKLLRPPKRNGFNNPKTSLLALSESLPFFRKAFGSYVHRVRAAQIHIWDGQYSHTVFYLWCGNNGLADRGSQVVSTITGRTRERYRNAELFAAPPENSILCATCEGRAIGAGLDGARIIGGRAVLFAPRV